MGSRRGSEVCVMVQSRPAMVGAICVAVALVGLAPIDRAAAAPTSERAAPTTVDDRQLVRSKGWRTVTDKKAYRKTLVRGTKAKASLTTRAAATAGASVTFQVGPK